MIRTGTPIREFYSNYRPPRYANKTIQKLIRTVPEKYLQGLGCIVLTNHSALSRRDRLGKVTSRKRRIPQSFVRGRYHYAYHGEMAWIELFVDKLEVDTAKVSWIPLLREIAFGYTLFHEVGHHIGCRMRPESREKEDVADDWSKKLSGNFFRIEYRYLVPVRKPLWRFIRALVAALYEGQSAEG